MYYEYNYGHTYRAKIIYIYKYKIPVFSNILKRELLSSTKTPKQIIEQIIFFCNFSLVVL